MWYQCLGTAAPAYVHTMFASLVPGLPGGETWPPACDQSWGVGPYEITPVLPISSSERQPEDTTSYFLELLLDCMVSQAPKLHWNEGSQMWAKSIEFLYERFKELYLSRIFHDFQITTDIYKPHLGMYLVAAVKLITSYILKILIISFVLQNYLNLEKVLTYLIMLYLYAK